MATIKLTDQLCLDVSAQPAPTSALLKYVQQLPSLQLNSLDLSKIGGLTLDQPALQSLSTGVSFEDPISLGDGAPTFSVAAGAHGSLRIITDADDLPGHDDSVDGLQDACYVAFEMDATVGVDVSATAAGIQFGASPSTRLELGSYSRFPLKAGITLVQAVQQTVANFSLPLNSSDLAALPPGQIARAAVTGTLRVSGSADLLTTANPLATASLPAPLPAVSVSAGGSITVGVSCQISTEYEIVSRKLDTGAVRLSWYHKNASDIAVHLDASEGISAGLTNSDLFSQVIAVISSSPKADLQELANAGLSDDQGAAIQDVVKAAVSRKLEIAVAAEISSRDSKAATFLYEIVPAALNDESRQAVDLALRGDLTKLHIPGLTGVSCVTSIWDTVRKTGAELNVNLLGILNYRSIASLSLEGKVLYEPATGSMVISDQATAQRIQSTQINFGADTQKLRHVLAESFLITAVYHGAKQIRAAPSLHCSHTFFNLQATTSPADMARKLRTGVAVGLLSSADVTPPATVSDFGRTLFTVATDYNSDMVTGMFLDSSDTPLPHSRYETVGRMAIQYLVQESDVDAVRLRPAIDDTLWSRMKDVGQPSFPSLFLGVASPLVAAIQADYTTIQWWADAMFATAQKLATVRAWLAQHPTASLEDADFQRLRTDLAGYLRQVAANTREEFGQPWGLIAMHELAARNSGAKLLISCPTLVVNKRTTLTAAAGS